MGSPEVVPNAFQSLPTRPPTPPREASHDLDVQPKQLLVARPADPRLSLNTPPNIYSPDSAATSSRTRKKVGFSTQAEYREPPEYSDGGGAEQHSTPVSLPSSTSRPAKSILKVTYGPNPLASSLGTPTDPSNASANIVAMLDSTIQQLAGSDRDSRLDAYMMLVRALKASNNLPDRVALQAKMSLFMQFMQRDITSKTPAGGIDASMVNHAVTLLITFLHFPSIASTISNDFAVFILDHCIRCFEDKSTPKDVVRHLMQVVAVQSFTPKVLTSDRVARMVAVLHRIEVQGKSIVMSRILTYKNLIKRASQHMVIHTDWLFDLFTDMLSSLKDIRAAAIALGLEAAFSIGKEKILSRRVVEIFNKNRGEQKYIDYYTEVLNGMARDEPNSTPVPQIWSVVLLLLRCPLEKWDLFNSWLRIIQKCFNSNNPQTKVEANYAWSRLVYLMHLDERAFSKIPIWTLAQPMDGQLKKKGTGKHVDDMRKVVLGVACNLYYYKFKPNTNAALLDGYWDDSVKPVMSRLIDRKSEDAQDCLAHATAILTGLLDCQTFRIWKEDHVIENPLVRPDELPAIDSKWVRRNSERVFAVIEPIIEKNFLELADRSSATNKLWQTLVTSVALAAAKEVKVSLDTAAFVAHSFNLLNKLWTNGPQSFRPGGDTSFPQFLSAIREFITTMANSLGLLPFTEKLLCLNQQNIFIPLATPSHRPSNGQGNPRAPLYHLFSILSTLPAGGSDNGDLAKFLQTTFAPFFAAKSQKGRADLAQELLQSLPMDALLPYGPWLMISDMVSAWLEVGHSSQQTTASGSETPVGHEYRDVVKVLERGLRSSPNLPWQHWQHLFNVLFERARDETGDAGVAIAVVDPLAKIMLDAIPLTQDACVPSNILKSTNEILLVAAHPRDRQAVDAARRRLWGTVIAGSRLSTFDPFEYLYKLVNSLLAHVYEKLEQYNTEGGEMIARLLQHLEHFLDRTNKNLFTKALSALQPGIACWIRDDQRRLIGPQLSTINESTKSLFDRICSLLSDPTRQPLLDLDMLEPLLCAAFESTHLGIVNTTVMMWNRVFDNAEDVRYPEKLRSILMTLAPHIDIVLPGLEIGSTGSGGQQRLFVDSQADLNAMITFSSSRSGPRPTSRPTSSAHHSPSPAAFKPTLNSKRPLDAPADLGPSKTPRRSLTPRLRHDDSQIKFAAIESSPIDGHMADSQLLTERQKEVRDRQRESAALFPEIRSSPGPKAGGLSHTDSPPPPISKPSGSPRRDATPERDTSYDDFVASTPTPRRGQPLALPENDNEAADPPSSPPEPRRTPLFAEIQSRSNTSSLLDEWQFSSSPISGSPIPSRQAAPQQLTLDEVPTEDVQRLGGDADGEDDDPSHLLDTSVIEVLAECIENEPTGAEEDDSMQGEAPIAEPVSEAAGVVTDVAVDDAQTSPSHHLLKAPHQDSPKSDNEVFVDAPTSPLPRTPRRLRNAPKVQTPSATRVMPSNRVTPLERSFEVSDVDETSLLRIVVELDARGPENPGAQKEISVAAPEEQEEEVLDCIVVQPLPEKIHGRRTRSRITPDLPTVPSTPAEDPTAGESQESPREGRRKRKRSFSKADELDGKKQRRRSVVDLESDEVPDSQPATGGEGMRLRSGRAAISNVRRSQRLSAEDAADSFSMLFSQSSQVKEESQASPLLEDGFEVENLSYEQEVQSQMAVEQAAEESRRRSQEAVQDTGEAEIIPAEESGVALADDEDMHDSEPPSQPQERAESRGEVVQPQKVGEILATLQAGLGQLREASLSRDEVYKIEDMFMDMKRELFEAERRGRV